MKTSALIFFTVVLLLLLAAPALGQEAPTQDPTAEAAEGVAMFDYDQNASLDIQESSTEMRGDVTVKDITYTSPVTGEPISAYLVLPPGNESGAGILYAHWYEPSSANSNRTEFLDEAVMMAQTYGVYALLPETMWSDPAWYNTGRSLDTDYDDAVRQVIELRRGLDVLMAVPNVDPDRIAYIGHDFGGMYGSLLTVVDRRAKAYVLIAAASDFNQWMLFGVNENAPGLDAYMEKMAALAPARFVADAAPAAILFQFGSEDFYTPESDFMAFYDAASDPKQLMVYEAEHAMDSDEIRANRITFLAGQLGLTTD